MRSLLLTFLALAPATGAAGLPPPPDPGEFLWDSAGLVLDDDATAIRQTQQRVYGAHDTPIVVATFRQRSRYARPDESIETLAREWFDHWGIGKREHNVGILMLISLDDRKARIELGADWGHRWDRYCQRVMDLDMVPAFKEGLYSRGIRSGVSALSEMAALGPNAEPPGPTLIESVKENELVRLARESQMLPGWLASLLLILGIASIVASFFLPAWRKPLLIFGILAVLAGITLWLVFFIFGMFARGRYRSGSSFGGGFSPGGFSSGGFSGGGGASGSW